VNRPNRQLPYILAAVGGGFLFISLFFEWLSGPSVPAGAAGRLGLSKSGWELFSGTDIFLAILGIATIVYCGLWLLGIEQWPWLRAFVRWGGLAALLIVLNYMIDQDNAPGLPSGVSSLSTDLGFGVYVALAASAAMLIGGLLLMEPELGWGPEPAPGRERARPEVGAPAAAAPAGAAPSGVAGAPRAPAPQAPPATAARPQAPAAPAPPATSAAPAAAAPPSSPAQPAAAPAMPAQPVAPAEPPAAHAGPPAGWYPDPQGLARLRYWDGAAWTEHTAP
jgi:Protein of unknown function (DUF2510)